MPASLLPFPINSAQYSGKETVCVCETKRTDWRGFFFLKKANFVLWQKIILFCDQQSIKSLSNESQFKVQWY